MKSHFYSSDAKCRNGARHEGNADFRCGVERDEDDENQMVEHHSSVVNSDVQVDSPGIGNKHGDDDNEQSKLTLSLNEHLSSVLKLTLIL